MENLPHYIVYVFAIKIETRLIQLNIYILCGGVKHPLSSNPNKFVNYGDILLIKQKK